MLLANPENAAARHNLGVTLLKANRIDEGIEQERRSLRIQPKYMLAMHNLALACLSKGDLTRARFWLREALDIAPDDPQLRQLQKRVRLVALAAGVRRAVRRVLGR